MSDAPGSPTFHHTSVLLAEVVHAMSPRAGGIYVDATVGGGGHSAALLRAAPGARVIGLDRDQAALAAAGEVLRRVTDEVGGSFTLIHRPFAELEPALAEVGVGEVDGILADLGVSSHQLDRAERGFSFGKDGPLDMRMDPSRGPTAAELVNTLGEGELIHILREYGEEREARRVVRAVIERRARAPFTRTLELAELVDRLLRRRGAGERIHPATRTFQALRIAVNGELDQLRTFLPAAERRLAPGGRLGVISFHSLEDRIVKHFIRQAERPCVCPPHLPVCVCGKLPTLETIERRGVVAGEAEIERNPRARSARLRIAQRYTGPSEGVGAGLRAGAEDNEDL